VVHVDAYRLGNVAEVDDLDLGAPPDDCVIVVGMTGIGQHWESVAESVCCGLPVTPKAI
jgi:hypothetical protein